MWLGIPLVSCHIANFFLNPARFCFAGFFLWDHKYGKQWLAKYSVSELGRVSSVVAAAAQTICSEGNVHGAYLDAGGYGLS